MNHHGGLLDFGCRTVGVDGTDLNDVFAGGVPCHQFLRGDTDAGDGPVFIGQRGEPLHDDGPFVVL